VRVVGQQNRDFGGPGEGGFGLLQGLVDGGFRDAVETFGPFASFDVDSDFEGETGAQEALSSLAVAPS
jgi:hypothetical protein